MSTLEEIARLSEVSRSTVSRVINDDPHVSPATREKVMDVVRQLNYRPNLLARSLAAGHTRTLGLIAPAVPTAGAHDPFFAVRLQAIARTCSAHGYTVMLWLAEPGGADTLDQVLANSLLAGVLVAADHLPDDGMQRLADTGLPFVLVDRRPHLPAAGSYVAVDNRRGALEATTHLLRLGRRRIAHLSGLLDTPAARERLQGYRDALAARGLAADPALLLEGDDTEATGAYLMQRLLRRPDPPDAVVAGSDLTALGALRALHDAGRRVPDDIALVGFDDIPAAATADPPLTTVRRPADRMAALAAETLIDIIEHHDTFPRHLLLPTELIIRASCGAP